MGLTGGGLAAAAQSTGQGRAADGTDVTKGAAGSVAALARLGEGQGYGVGSWGD